MRFKNKMTISYGLCIGAGERTKNDQIDKFYLSFASVFDDQSGKRTTHCI